MRAARSRQLGQTAYWGPQLDGNRGELRGAGTTVHCNTGSDDNCSCARGTGIGFPFTFKVASMAVSFTIRYHAPLRSGEGAATWRRAH